MGKIKLFFQNIRSPVDKPDVFIISGISLLGWGLWMYKPWLSPTVTGSILFAYGALASFFGDGG